MFVDDSNNSNNNYYLHLKPHSLSTKGPEVFIFLGV